MAAFGKQLSVVGMAKEKLAETQSDLPPHPRARVAEKFHPGGVFGPVGGAPAHAGAAEDAFRVGHHDRHAAVGRREGGHALG